MNPDEVEALEKMASDPRLDAGPVKEVIRLSVQHIRTLEALLTEAREVLEVAEEGLRFSDARDVYLADVRALLAKLSAREGR